MGSDLPKVTELICGFMCALCQILCPVPGDKDKDKHCLCPRGTDDPMEEKDTK